MLSVSAVGAEPISYQWRVNGAELEDGAGVSGAATHELILSGIQLSNAGEYEVVVRNPYGNVISAAAIVTVSQIELEIAAQANQSKVYGEPDPAAFTYSITRGSLQETDTLTGALTRAPGDDVGGYPIKQGTLSAGPNYALTFVGSDFTIVPAVASVAAQPQTKAYGEPNPPLDAVVTGEVAAGDPINYTLETSATALSGAGVYPITVVLGANPNYSVTSSDSALTVDPAAATVVADPQTKVYGTVDPALYK
jgi:large repetitive protein